jgi:cation transport ATPase
LGAASIVNPTLGRVLEGVTSPKDALSEITKANISADDKIKLQQLLYQAQEVEMQEVSKRWSADMTSDNKLSKSVRPLTLIFLFVSTVVLIFIDSGFINFAVDDEWKELLKMLLITITAAYFGGRSYEKGKSIIK